MTPSTISIRSRDHITICNSQGVTMAGFAWDGQALRHTSGKAMRVTGDFGARIEAAAAAAHGEIADYKTGAELHEMAPGDKQGYTYYGIRNEVHGVYVRRVADARTVTLPYTTADVIR